MMKNIQTQNACAIEARFQDKVGNWRAHFADKYFHAKKGCYRVFL